MSSIQDYINIKAETTGLTVQDAFNVIIDSSGFTIYDICKGINTGESITYTSNVSMQDMLNDFLFKAEIITTKGISVQECFRLISLIPNE